MTSQATGAFYPAAIEATRLTAADPMLRTVRLVDVGIVAEDFVRWLKD